MEPGLPKLPRAGNQMGYWDVTAQRWTVHPYVVWPVVQPTLTLGNVNGVIAALAVSNPPTQAEVTALRDACETLADDLRALAAIVVATGICK